LAGLLKIPVHATTIDGKLVTNNPLTGIQQTQVGPTARQKAINSEDAKTIADLDKASIEGGDTGNTLSGLKDIVTSDTWKKMHPFPIGNKQQVAAYGTFGSPEQQQMAGDFYAKSGQVVANMAQQFKGQFRKGEQSLVTGTKPNAADTVAVQQGKIEALQMMNSFMTQRRKMASQFMRQGSSEPDAMDKADTQLRGDLIRKVATEKAGGKKAIEASAKATESAPTAETGGMVKVVSPDGKIIRLPKEGAERLIKDHPDHKIVG